MDWVDKPQNYKDLYGILQLLQGSHLDNFPLKILKLGWVAFPSVTFQFKCLDFQCNQCKKLIPVLSRFRNGLWGQSRKRAGKEAEFKTLVACPFFQSLPLTESLRAGQ